MKSKEEFIKAFRSVLRKHNVLSNDTDFKFDDVDISEQELADYGSKYRDLQPTVNLYRNEAEKASVLDEIDFETELLTSERIDVDYILDLLSTMVDGTAEVMEKVKQTLLKKVKNDPKLRSKLELIEKFIEEQLEFIQNPYEVSDKLYEYVEAKRDMELTDIAEDCHIQKDELNDVIQRYLWRGIEIPPADDLRKLIKGNVKYLEQNKIIRSLSERIAHYTQVYCVGWS